MKSLIRTSAVIDWPDSLMPPSVAMCEWQSMIPGLMCLPRASITRASARHGNIASHGHDLAPFDHQRRILQHPLLSAGPDRGVLKHHGFRLWRNCRDTVSPQWIIDCEHRAPRLLFLNRLLHFHGFLVFCRFLISISFFSVTDSSAFASSASAVFLRLVV